ncbi:hypothetical protein DOTSEDRAFT_70380 [Dothistroma septosporum NZE10]|uniref:Zn(2)-C6 fungal-type domain-containing protein n=1 Tax=Dothistroma septosporum (strain NZE10 / CBS 128990) TaxID=675120 RepID=N1PVI3_DOTSN|nr:hypothetical protein DOTSEDRAFT_70380 [Dothistroma septosporum NZE10]
MVYRGKPSAGCENCRKAKKRCGLEQPACERCVKLKKSCSGYRDTTQLQVHDESVAVKQKADRQKARTTVPSTRVRHGFVTTISSSALAPHNDSPSSRNGNIVLPLLAESEGFNSYQWTDHDIAALVMFSGAVVPTSVKLSPDDVATTYFMSHFTSPNGHWMFLREWASSTNLDPALSLAIRACGMAALNNVEHVVLGHDYSTSLYTEALGLLNAALRDPQRCTTDGSLIAVAMLSYYENITCNSRRSIASWKAHISGATQLLKLRGKAQFKTSAGRMLFRETRAQIMVHCIWDDLEPPAFLWDLENELEKSSPNFDIIAPADQLTRICYNFASLRSKMRLFQLSDFEAMQTATKIELSMIQWSIDAMSSPLWTFQEVEVADSPDVWDGIVHSYEAFSAASVWNTHRSMRIMLTRTQELLTRRFKLPKDQEDEQLAYFKKVRRRMTEDICAGTPTQLGHASPAPNSPCILVTAYSSIWPLFFAGTCALERISPQAWTQVVGGETALSSSAPIAQASWIIGRLSYISKNIGLKWADGIAATLQGDFAIIDDVLPEYDSEPEWRHPFKEARKMGNNQPAWVQNVRNSGRGPRILIEDVPMHTQPRSEYGPIWRHGGRPTGDDPTARDGPR